MRERVSQFYKNVTLHIRIVSVQATNSIIRRVTSMATKEYSLSHTKWMCKYHIIFTPKYRRKIIYNQLIAPLIKPCAY